MLKPEHATALRERRSFKAAHLRGEPVTPYNQTADYERGTRGSAVRIFAGALSEHGTAGVIGTSPLLPPLGELDPAPAMGLALGEASYVVYSYDTPIAWWLGPEVYQKPPEGRWIEVAKNCCPEYGRFSRATSCHQNAVSRALSERTASHA